MGLFANAAKQIRQESDGKFEPLDLNEGNVQAIFNRCLATKNTPKTEMDGVILFKENMGYSEDSTPIIFDMTEIRENERSIQFLFGQLQMRHIYDTRLTPQKAQKKYDGTLWTQNSSILVQFLCLGNIINIFPPFCANGNDTVLSLERHTLSPKDPAFPAWWEEHKAEWES